MLLLSEVVLPQEEVRVGEVLKRHVGVHRQKGVFDIGVSV